MEAAEFVEKLRSIEIDASLLKNRECQMSLLNI